MRSLRWGLLVGVFSLASLAQAEMNYGIAGCGLGGSTLPKRGKFIQIIAGIVNAMSFQSSAISSGSSGCKPNTMSAEETKQEQFVVANLGTLSKEIAQGSGSSLTAFAETLGCSASDQNAVNETLQANYQGVFAAPGAVAVLKAAKQALRTNAAIANNCDLVNI